MKGILIIDNELSVHPVLDAQGKIDSGIVIDFNDYERVERIIVTAKGDLKIHPTAGFGIYQYVKSQAAEKKILFKSELTKELKADGFKNASVTMTDELLDFSVDV